MRNPFTAGKWVRGEDFFGRQDLLQQVLDGDRNNVWIVGTRRLGKTSMLKQLEYLSHSTAHAGQTVALYWDLQGSRNLDGLKEGLLESVELGGERFREIGVDVDKLEELTAFEVLHYLERQARNKDRRLLLLCDECEELINIQKACPEALPEIRRALQQGECLRTVLTATRRLGQLEHSASSGTSHFLHGFIPPLYLSRLGDNEARALIQRGRFEPDDVQEIMDKTDNHPYLIQLICERLFEGRRLDAVIEEVRADDLVAHFFCVDYEDLEPAEKKILLLLHHQSLDADKLTTRIGIDRDRVIAFLRGLNQFGWIRQLDGEYGISNFFLEMWLQREAARLWVEAAKSARQGTAGSHA
jgi:hypothetical protein